MPFSIISTRHLNICIRHRFIFVQELMSFKVKSWEVQTPAGNDHEMHPVLRETQFHFFTTINFVSGKENLYEILHFISTIVNLNGESNDA